MKLWLLRPISDEDTSSPWNPWYDKAFGFVVRAKTETSARKLASEMSGDESSSAWHDAALSSCVELTNDGPAEVIIRDFAAA